MPTAWVMDPSREPMIALKMNDEPLPPIHGYPARLIVPGLYGYVSATKWLKELELTTLEAFDGYWVPLGWAKEAPILTQSRIDTPRGGVTAGQVADRRRRLGARSRRSPGSRSPSTGSGATPGCRRRSRMRPGSSGSPTGRRRPATHVIMVRATDGTGVVQTELQSPPAPDGARGWYRHGPRRSRSSLRSGPFRYRVRHASTTLSVRSPRALRGRHRRPARRPDVLPAGPRRPAGRERRAREGPGRGPRGPPRRAARRARATRCRGGRARTPPARR